MDRYLILDLTSSACVRLARDVCDESDGWIRDVLSLEDERAQEWLLQANAADRWETTLLEVDKGTARAFSGFRLRTRMLSGLGISRTWRIGQRIARNLAAAEDEGRRENTGGLGRRVFLRQVATVCYGLGIATGLGFFSFASAKPASREVFQLQKLLRQLGRNGRQRVLGNDLANLWNTVKYLYSVEQLVASGALTAAPGGEAIRQLLSSNREPETFVATRTVHEGKILTTDAFLFGSGPQSGVGARSVLHATFLGDAISNPAQNCVCLVEALQTRSGKRSALTRWISPIPA